MSGRNRNPLHDLIQSEGVEPKLQTLVYAALLHDIGKFYQRTGAVHGAEYGGLTAKDHGFSGAHAKWSADLIRSVLQNDEVEDLVLHHHTPEKSKYRDMADILQKSDHLSAAIDRSKRGQGEKGDPKKEHLWSIFTQVSPGRKGQTISLKWHHTLGVLSPTRDRFPTDEPDRYHWNNQEAYGKLWKGFVDEISIVGRSPHPTTLLALLRKYTSSIPSAAYVDYPDIPLYDHAKTTAALASCLWLSKEPSPFLLVQGDLSGIQQFIFNVATPESARKGMAKRLRGRSFWLSLFADAVVQEMIKASAVCEANILWNTGGNFLLLLPNNNRTREAVDQITRTVNGGLMKETDFELYLAVGSLQVSAEEIKDFAGCLERLHLVTGRKKLRKFSECDLTPGPSGEIRDLERFCKICEHPVGDGSPCPACSLHEEIGQRIAHAKYLNRGKDLAFGFVEYGLSSSYDLTDHPLHEPDIYTAAINSTDFLISGSNEQSFILLGNTVPLHHHRILTFGELAQIAQGDQKLGLLKADVDNLGKIFALGLEKKQRSISRISTLSSQFEFFFSGYLNSICQEFGVYADLCAECRVDKRKITILKEEDDQESGEIRKVEWTAYECDEPCERCRRYFIPTLYITFSGGDDLLIIGPYDHIIRFADRLRKEFSDFVCNNPEITLSAGIVAVPPRMPLAHAVKAAEEQLEAAKGIPGKDRVALFGECLPWLDRSSEKGYSPLLIQGMAMEKAILEEETISRSFLHAVNGIWKMAFAHCDDIHDHGKKKAERQRIKRYLPYLKYQIARNVKISEKTRIEGLIVPSFGWARFPIQWTIMRTRRK